MSKRRKPQEQLRDVHIGADIEVFLQDKNTGEIVSAEGIIKGSKETPNFFKDGNPFFATSLDNVMAEFNIPPAKSAKEFHANIVEALGYIEENIPSHLKWLAAPSARVNEKYLQTENALLFGCEPDFNAWKNGMMNEKPECSTNLRSCGGHLHFSYKNPNPQTTMAVVRSMDAHIGLPMILAEPDNERKTLYGKAGAYRTKGYGGEYRSVSNYYLNSPSLTKWAFDATLAAIEFVNQGLTISREEGEGIQAAINFNDKKLAETLCTYFGIKKAS